MSKMFSVVTLASDSGLLEEYYAPGSPDCAEDLLEDEIIRDDLRSLPKSDRVYAEVGTYLYGEGETERASEEELYASVQVDWIGGHSFGFVVEDVLPDYTDEPESELEDEDDLEL